MNVKTELFEQCKAWVDRKIALANATLKDLDKSSHDETKSSAGDKYETGREMIQIERDKAHFQLVEAQRLLKTLQLIENQSVDQLTGLGSLYETNNGSFYISIPIGRLTLASTDYFAVSPVSPIGKHLIDSSVGDSMEVNGNHYKILKIS